MLCFIDKPDISLRLISLLPYSIAELIPFPVYSPTAEALQRFQATAPDSKMPSQWIANFTSAIPNNIPSFFDVLKKIKLLRVEMISDMYEQRSNFSTTCAFVKSHSII